MIKKLLRTMVKVRRSVPRPIGFKWVCPEEIVLKLGKTYKVQKLPAQFETGTPKRCFANAAELVWENPERLIYVEGFCILDRLPITQLHAWVVERGSMKVIDVTTDKFVAYCGIPFKTEYLNRRWKARPDGVSLLDDWRDDFQILKMSEEEILDVVEVSGKNLL